MEKHEALVYYDKKNKKRRQVKRACDDFDYFIKLLSEAGEQAGEAGSSFRKMSKILDDISKSVAVPKHFMRRAAFPFKTEAVPGTALDENILKIIEEELKKPETLFTFAKAGEDLEIGDLVSIDHGDTGDAITYAYKAVSEFHGMVDKGGKKDEDVSLIIKGGTSV